MFELFNDVLGKNDDHKGVQKKIQSRCNKKMTPGDSLEVWIIADFKEGGGREEKSLHLVNQCCLDNDAPVWSLNQVRGLTQRLNPVTVAAKKAIREALTLTHLGTKNVSSGPHSYPSASAPTLLLVPAYCLPNVLLPKFLLWVNMMLPGGMKSTNCAKSPATMEECVKSSSIGLKKMRLMLKMAFAKN